MGSLAAFRDSLKEAHPPTGLSPVLEALWWDGKGEWDEAHRRAMAIDAAEGSLVHAYLHRKEGDLPNAGYWYRRALRPVSVGSLEAEWDALVAEFLGNIR